MIDNYEKITNFYLKENETLWSIYFLPNYFGCITNFRLFIIESSQELPLISYEVLFDNLTGISSMYSSKTYSYVGIHSIGQVYKLRMETITINRFIQDVIKHKSIYSSFS